MRVRPCPICRVGRSNGYYCDPCRELLAFLSAFHEWHKPPPRKQPSAEEREARKVVRLVRVATPKALPEQE